MLVECSFVSAISHFPPDSFAKCPQTTALLLGLAGKMMKKLRQDQITLVFSVSTGLPSQAALSQWGKLGSSELWQCLCDARPVGQQASHSQLFVSTSSPPSCSLLSYWLSVQRRKACLSRWRVSKKGKRAGRCLTLPCRSSANKTTDRYLHAASAPHRLSPAHTCAVYSVAHSSRYYSCFVKIRDKCSQLFKLWCFKLASSSWLNFCWTIYESSHRIIMR